jgi:hypothetical protein
LRGWQAREGSMKRERPADDARRTAIIARLKGTPTLEIARRLERKHETIKGYLSSCGSTIAGAYHLNSLIAKALFTEKELLDVGAIWDGRSWVGRDRSRS